MSSSSVMEAFIALILCFDSGMPSSVMRLYASLCGSEYFIDWTL